MLKLTEVSSGYKDREVLKNINLEIGKSEIVSLIGLNGSGKSTLLRTMLGIIQPSHGQVELNGQSVSEIPRLERARQITLLESSPQVHFPMTVRELLQISVRTHGDMSIYQEALEAVDMTDFEERNVQELSSGELKRAFLAHTLCTMSTVILLDEPLTHLDWHHQNYLVKSVKSWRRRHGTTFVLALHELEWVVRISDSACVLADHKIVIQDRPENIFHAPSVGEVFAFRALIDENPLDGSRRLTLAERQNVQKY